MIGAKIDAGAGDNVGALIGRLDYSTVSGCSVQDSTVTGGSIVGGLVGDNGGTIKNCFSSCIVDGNSVGGLVGINVGGIISNCFSNGIVSGNSPVGGLVGQNGTWFQGMGEMLSIGGTIDHCYSTCDVTGMAAVGGLVGFNDEGSITQCYSSGRVSGNERIGGLVGYGNARVTFCFWDVEASGLMASASGIGKTTTEMQSAETFLGWGACGPYWTIDEGLDYPRLAWENIPGEFITGPIFGGGTGTADDPFLIYTAEQLNTVGLSFCDWDKHFKLMADIDLLAFDGKEGRPAFNVIGIGRWDAFAGVFDGNDHIVSNLTLTGKGNLGMFGYTVSGSEVRDLGVMDVNIIGSGNWVGALAGRNGGDVIRCYSSGTISGNRRIGGLIGASSGSVGTYLNGFVTQCYSTCVVSGEWIIGGLVGGNSGIITQCYSTGRVHGDGRVGGLVGDNDGEVTNCYSTSAVDGRSSVGGLIGLNYLSPVNQCYSTGAVNGSSSVGGLIGSDYSGYDVALSFWDMQTSGQITSNGGAGKTTAEMQVARTFYTWGGVDELVWKIDEGNDYPRLWWEDRPGDEIKPISLSDFLLGTGTEDDPYLIYTSEQLNLVGLGVKDWSKHFKLMADIDLFTYHTFEFNPIGRPYSFPFAGVFDGSGHAILNFSYSCQDDSCIGLFGYVDNPIAEIKNLKLIEPNIDGGSAERVGALVGFMNSGTITNCYVEGGSIRADKNVSGLVGFNGTDGQILNCYSTSVVSGGNYLGVLAGRNWGLVSCCYSNGVVSSSEGHYIGGLIGWNVGIATNSYSTAAASAKWAVGGLVGSNSGDVILCYSTGAVRGSSPFGGLVGYGFGDAIQSFWDTQTSGRPYSNGGTGLTTDEMQTADTFLNADWDFVDETTNGTEDIWWILEGQDYPRLWWEAAEQ